jgi:DNA-directed RNA polymerase specialized sigma subunit
MMEDEKIIDTNNEIYIQDRISEEFLNFLKSYSINKKIIMLNKYEKEYFPAHIGDECVEIPICDEAILKAKMFEVKRFVLSLGNCNEKLILYYYYIREETVERCAELIGISRRSGFRLKSRAITYGVKYYIEYMKNKKY